MVASLATMTHSRPETRPMPQMIDALCTSPEYMPQAASWPISRKGDPGSSSVRTRSRGRSLPRAVCLSRAAWSPPTLTVATFCFRSSTSAFMRSAFALNSGERALSWLLMTLIPPRNQGQTTFFSFALQVAANDHALDIARALVDLRHAHVAPETLDREVADVTVAAVDLDRVGADPFRHFGGEELRHGRLADAGLAFGAKLRRVQVQLAGGFDLRRHVRKAKVDRLVFDQRLAHALALVRIRDCGFERAACDAGRLRRDVDAPGL